MPLQEPHHAVRQVPPRRPGHAARGGRAHRRDRQPVLRAHVRRAPGAARRPVQPRQPGRGPPAAGAGRLRRRVRRAWSADPTQLPDHLLSRIAHKHASLGITPGPVPGRPRPPVLGHRRRARRRGHPRGRRRLGRGVLADGLRADQPGTRPVQRPRRARPRPVWRHWRGRREDPRRPTTWSPSWSTHRRPAGQDLAARPVRHRAWCRCPTASTSPASTASPAPTTASTASSRSSGSTAAASPTARCPTCCTTSATSATS